MKTFAPSVLIVAMAGAPAAFAQTPQTPSPAGGPAFEVASMKASTGLSASAVGYSCQGGPGTAMPERWTCTSVPLSVLVAQGWSGFRSAGLPSSNVPGNRFDIAARVPPGTSMEDFRLMVRRLLQERIGLTAHQEKRETNVTELVVAKGGIKMKEAEPAPPGAEPPPLENSQRFMEQIPMAPGSTLPGGVTLGKDGIPQVPPGFRRIIQTYKDGAVVIVCRMIGSADIAQLVGPPPYGPVADMTGLTGKYDFTLTYDPSTVLRAATMPAAPPGPQGSEVPEASAPGLTLESGLKKLGLEYRQGKEMLDFLVVDHFNSTPTDN